MMRPGSGPTRIATPLACAVALLACSPAAPAREPQPSGPPISDATRVGAARADPRVFAYDRAAQPDARVRARSAADGFDELEIDFASPVVGRVPAYLLVPRGEGPFPALVLMHGLPGRPGSLRRLAAAYARAGVAALAIAAPYNRPDLPGRDARLIPAPRFDELDREDLIHTVKDLRRALDVLEARQDVEGAALGFVGHSYGGTAGALLAAVEPRLAGFVLMAAFLADRLGFDVGRFEPPDSIY